MMIRTSYLTVPGWAVPAGPLGLGLIQGIAGLARVLELATDPVASPTNARFVDAPRPLVDRITAAAARHRFAAHGAWMRRGYAIDLAEWHNHNRASANQHRPQVPRATAAVAS